VLALTRFFLTTHYHILSTFAPQKPVILRDGIRLRIIRLHFLPGSERPEKPGVDVFFHREGRVEDGGLRFLEFRIQCCSELVEGGEKKGEEISSNFSVSCHKRETNFRIEGTENLWILKDRNMVSAEMRES